MQHQPARVLFKTESIDLDWHLITLVALLGRLVNLIVEVALVVHAIVAPYVPEGHLDFTLFQSPQLHIYVNIFRLSRFLKLAFQTA